MGAPGTRPVAGRAGAARGGMGAPGTDEVPSAAGAGPGATTWVGGWGDFGCGCDTGVDGDAESSGVGAAGVDVGGTDPGGVNPVAEDPGRTVRSRRSGVRCRV
jgi:hypothetical protein